MEDAHITDVVELVDQPDNYGQLFGVFDGHSGKEIAEYARDNFKKFFEKQETFKRGDFKQALHDCFIELDA